MADLHSFDSAALRSLKKKIDDVIEANAQALVRGNARMDTAHDTAMRYVENVGYVRALENVLAICEEVEDDLRKVR